MSNEPPYPAVLAPLVTLHAVHTSAFTEIEMARDIALLDAEEAERCRRFLRLEDRRDYAAAHALLRSMLTAAAPGVAPEAWRFERTERGKPYLPEALAGDPPLRFNLSHTRGMAVCAVTRTVEIGVDVEWGGRIIDTNLLMPRVCSADERAQLAIASSARLRRFLDFWTLKEAYLKALGLGIGVALDEISFDLRTPDTIRLSLQGQAATGWWIALLDTASQHHVAVAMASAIVPVLEATLVDRTGPESMMHAGRSLRP